MKYKRLTLDELTALEPEFVNFLASAQITGADWVKMKENELEKAEELIDVFSDMVYEKVMNKIKFLEHRDKKVLNIVGFEEDKIMLVGLRVKDNCELDLTSNDLTEKWQEVDLSLLSVIKSERLYSKDKGLEVFDLIQQGYLITDDRLFKVLRGA